MSDQTYTNSPYAKDANGRTFEYRRVASVLERRELSSSYWAEVTGEEFRRMMPTELRVVADVLELGVLLPKTGGQHD